MSAILENTAERSGVYGLLAQLWIAEPDAQLIKAMRADDITAALPDWFGLPEPDELENLQSDFTQLFIGPKDQLPPYQSVWQFGQFEAAPTGAMRTYFDVIGYEPDQTQAEGVMPDHMALQFDVMSYLLKQVDGTVADQPEMSDLLTSFFDDALSWCLPLLLSLIHI